ncbi:hypothetical protein L7F22_053768 [Adiantum nelumboides]|nr:hypothetical protein [Adiantum nelumboides]
MRPMPSQPKPQEQNPPDFPHFSFMRDLDDIVPPKDIFLEEPLQQVAQSKPRLAVNKESRGIKKKHHKKNSRKQKTFKSGDKDVKFDSLNGRRDNDKALAFIRRFEVAFAEGNFKETSKLRHVGMYLKGTTSSWWLTQILENRKPQDWTAFKKAFYAQFLPPDFEQEFRLNFSSICYHGLRSLNYYSVKVQVSNIFFCLHGNVESMAVLHHGRDDGRKRRDAVILAFRDAKLTVLEFDDSTHTLRTSSMHYFEGLDWQHLKRGAEKFAKGPLVRADPQGRCGGALVYDTQMIILKAGQEAYGFGEEEEGLEPSSALCVHVKSSYVVSMRELDIIHIKDFTFLHGYIEPVLILLHEKEPTWAGRAAIKRHTCVLTALSINTTLKQHPLIWSAANLPYDAYMLLAVPSPIGGVIVVAANSIHYHSQSTSCSLGLNDFAAWPEGSGDISKSKINVELDSARAAWISHDVALFSTKTGTLLLLSLIYDGRTVQKLELMKSRASVLTSCMSMLGDMFFFLGSRLGDSLFVQFTCGSNLEQADVEGDVAMPPAKRLHRATYEDLQEGAGVEELSLYHFSSTNTDLLQKNFNFLVRDSFINIGPVRDFAHGLRMNADPDASGAAKQSNYELVCCSGHGKNGALSVLHQSLRPELITEVELPGCKGIWTVYYKGSRSLMPDTGGSGSNVDEEFHAYLIISLETRTMVNVDECKLLVETLKSLNKDRDPEEEQIFRELYMELEEIDPRVSRTRSRKKVVMRGSVTRGRGSSTSAVRGGGRASTRAPTTYVRRGSGSGSSTTATTQENVPLSRSTKPREPEFDDEGNIHNEGDYGTSSDEDDTHHDSDWEIDTST